MKRERRNSKETRPFFPSSHSPAPPPPRLLLARRAPRRQLEYAFGHITLVQQMQEAQRITCFWHMVERGAVPLLVQCLQPDSPVMSMAMTLTGIMFKGGKGRLGNGGANRREKEGGRRNMDRVAGPARDAGLASARPVPTRVGSNNNKSRRLTLG